LSDNASKADCARAKAGQALWLESIMDSLLLIHIGTFIRAAVSFIGNTGKIMVKVMENARI